MIFDFDAITAELKRLQDERKDFMARLGEFTGKKNKEIANYRAQVEELTRDNQALKQALAIMSRK